MNKEIMNERRDLITLCEMVQDVSPFGNQKTNRQQTILELANLLDFIDDSIENQKPFRPALTILKSIRSTVRDRLEEALSNLYIN